MYGGFNDGGQLSQLLMRRLNLTGDSPVPVLMPELGANLVYENDRVEWGWLKGEQRFSFGVQTAAVAAERPVFSLQAPTGLVCVIQELLVGSSSSAVHYAVMNPTAPAITAPIGIGNPANLDDRFSNSASGVVVQSGTSAVAPTGTRVLSYVNVPGNSQGVIARDVVLTGRLFLTASATSTNIPANYWVRGYIRRALPGELV